MGNQVCKFVRLKITISLDMGTSGSAGTVGVPMHRGGHRASSVQWECTKQNTK